MSLPTSPDDGVNVHGNWPYATDVLLETRNPKLISEHGTELLCRALSTRRLVAFVGSGVTMAYGRLTWAELYEIQKKRTLAFYSELESLVEAKDFPEPIKRLKSSFDNLGFKGSQGIEIGFKVLETLHDKLCNALKSKAEIDNKNKKWLKHLIHISMTEHTMEILTDDSGHCLFQLCQALDGSALDASSSKAKIFDQEFLQDPTLTLISSEAWIRHTLKRFDLPLKALRHVFSIERMKEIVPDDSTSVFFSEFVKMIESIVRESGLYTSKGGSITTPPINRYLISTLFGIRSNYHSLVSNMRDSIEKINEERGTSATRKTRRDYVHKYNDPLDLLRDRLGVSRFLTTNYDHEIDRMFRDAQLGQAVEPDDETDALSPQDPPPGFRLVNFEQSQTATLVAYSARDRGGDAASVHLHGRAKPQGEIVVTEEDYQKRYAFLGSNRAMVDEAVRMLFNGNPLLFIGAGMSEADLLRPLRQFMSEPGRISDRAAVAFVPATHEVSKLNSDAITLMERYGVYTVYYGLVRIDHKAIDTLELLGGKHWLDVVAGQLEKWARDREERIWQPKDSCKDLGQQEIDDFNKIKAAALSVLDALESASSLEIDQIDLKKDENLALSFQTPIFAIRAACAIGGGFKQGTPLNNLRSELFAIRNLTSSAKSEIITKMLCARLLRLRWNFDDWQKRYRERPACRPSPWRGD